MLEGKRILLILSGGIAAYKGPDLVRRLRQRGATVRCVLTAGSAKFVTALTLGAVSEDKVFQDLFSLTDEEEMGHIRLSREADLVLVAPATWRPGKEAQGYSNRYQKDLAPLLEKARTLVNAGKGSELMEGVDFVYCPNTRVAAATFVDYYRDNPDRDTPSLI